MHGTISETVPLPVEVETDAIVHLQIDGQDVVAKPSDLVLEAILRENKISARVESRIKRLYSIQQKLTVQQIPVEQVYDLFAIRIICQSVQDCYSLLYPLRSTWQPCRNKLGIENGVPQIGALAFLRRQRPIPRWLPRIQEHRAPELRFQYRTFIGSHGADSQAGCDGRRGQPPCHEWLRECCSLRA